MPPYNHRHKVDYRLRFESTRSLFAEVTPARLDLLRRLGPGPAADLLAALPTTREPATVVANLDRLEVLGLIEDGRLLVSF